MNKRPLCWVLLCFAAFLGLLELLGITHGGDPRGNPRLEELAAREAYGEASGLAERYETKQDVSYLYIKSASLAVSAETFSNLTIRIRMEQGKYPGIGSRIKVKGPLYAMAKASNPGQFDTKFYYQTEGIDLFMKGESCQVIACRRFSIGDWLWRFRERLKKVLKELAPGEAGELSAMLLGEKSLLEEETKKIYKLLGIYHILAISGTHLTVIGMGVTKALEKAGAGLKLSSAAAGAVMIFYGAFTGNSVSTLRAVIMFLLYAGARIIGRTYDMLSALALSGILILLDNPGYLYHSGFLLSYLAVAGIGILTPVLSERKREGKAKKVREGLTGGMAVFLAQLPVLEYFFYEIPLFSLAVNLLVIPLLPLVLASGFLGATIGLWAPMAGRVILLGACLPLRLYEEIGLAVQRMPFSSLVTGQPDLWQAGVYYLLLAAAVIGKRRGARIFFVAGIMAAVLTLGWRPGPQFRLTMLDVGQGDCLALETVSGNCYLIDGGSSSVQQVGAYRILPYIKQRGRSIIEGVFVTHPDQDHISGILEILEEMTRGGSVKVKRLFLPLWMREQEDQSIQEAAQKSGVPVRYLRKGDVMLDGETRFRILYPDEEEKGSDANSGSLTMMAEYGKLKVLLTGDLTGEGEEKVTEEAIGCQILKVAHHGSASSTGDGFLDRAAPSFALISCGQNNRYGHPSPQLERRLEERGILVFDTHLNGAVSFICQNQDELKIETFH